VTVRVPVVEPARIFEEDVTLPAEKLPVTSRLIRVFPNEAEPAPRARLAPIATLAAVTPLTEVTTVAP